MALFLAPIREGIAFSLREAIAQSTVRLQLCIFGKALIVSIEAETAEVFYQEHSGCAGIALAGSVNLSNG